MTEPKSLASPSFNNGYVYAEFRDVLDNSPVSIDPRTLVSYVPAFWDLASSAQDHDL